MNIGSTLYLNLEVVEGSGLAGKDRSGKSDPYCKIKFKGIKKHTRFIAQTLDPVWKEHFHMGTFAPEDVVHITCWDRDRIGKHDILGYFAIQMCEFMNVGEYHKTYVLDSRPGKNDKDVKGTITIKATITDSSHAKKGHNRITSIGKGVLRNIPSPIPTFGKTSGSESNTSGGNLRQSLSSSGSIPTQSQPLPNHDMVKNTEFYAAEEEDPDKAVVRRKLGNWLKLRPDRDKMEEELSKMGVIEGDENVSTRVFGATLDEVMNRQKKSHPDMKIPLIVHQLITLLLSDKSTFEETGLFRISGQASVMVKVKSQIDSGKDVDLSAISRDDAASLLKEFIRNLPEPLFTFMLGDQWTQSARLTGPTLIDVTRSLLLKLPGHNRNLWYEVNTFLYQLSQKSDINKMTAENIGIVIGPNLLWQRETLMPVMAMNQVVANLVINYTAIFHDWEVQIQALGLNSGSVIKGSVQLNASAAPSLPERPIPIPARPAGRGTGGAVQLHLPRPTGEPLRALSPREPQNTELSSRLASKPVTEWTEEDVKEWMTEKGFGEYADVFLSHHVDGPRLLTLSSDDLLNELDVKSLGHRKKLLFRRDELKIED